nr:unnamed protein product [Spirometra erinaceieuropaei]
MNRPTDNRNGYLYDGPTLPPAPYTTAPALIILAPNPRAPPSSITATSTISVTITTATINTITSALFDADRNTPGVPSVTRTFANSDADSVPTCPHCNCTSTSQIDLVIHLRIHRTETGEPVLGATTPTFAALTVHVHPPTGLLVHMRLHISLR